MKTIKVLTAVLFAACLSLFVGVAFGSAVAMGATFAVLMAGHVILSKSKFDTTGVFGEFLTILDSDTEEVKSAKKTMNQLGEAAVTKAKKEAKEEAERILKDALEKAKKEAEDSLKGEIKVLKDEVEKNKKEADDALTALNRLKEAAIENEAKGVTFAKALDIEMAKPEIIEGLNELKNGVKGSRVRMQVKASDMSLANISGLSVANVQLLPGIVPIPKRKLHVRDIMQTGRMTTSDLHFLKETSVDGAPTAVAEAAQRAQMDVNYIESVAPSQFISAYVKISRKSLDDITALRASLAARLLEEYLKAEDAQILTGNATGSNLSGLLHGTNSFTYAGTGANAAEILIDSIASIEENDHQATAILMRPNAWAAIAKISSTGNTAGIYSLPGLGSITMQNGVLHINDCPVYKTTAMLAGEALTGDFVNGAMLFLREDPIVEFFDQDGTNVQTNQVTVRVQARVALPIFYGGSNGAFTRANLVSGGYQS